MTIVSDTIIRYLARQQIERHANIQTKRCYCGYLSYSTSSRSISTVTSGNVENTVNNNVPLPHVHVEERKHPHLHVKIKGKVRKEVETSIEGMKSIQKPWWTIMTGNNKYGSPIAETSSLSPSITSTIATTIHQLKESTNPIDQMKMYMEKTKAEEMELPIVQQMNMKERFQDQYELQTLLGKGSFSSVYKAMDKTDGSIVAVKVIKSNLLAENFDATSISAMNQESLIKEAAILKTLQHPHIIQNHGLYIEQQDGYEVCYLVMEHCDRGSVTPYICKNNLLPEAKVRVLVKQLLTGIAHCHANGHIHSDIKSDNILLSSHSQMDEVSPGHVKIADFGLAEKLDESTWHGSSTRDLCGTPMYLSPEMVRGLLAGKPADIWSTGILTYMLLSGDVPYAEAHNESELYKLISLGAIWYESPRWHQQLSPLARNFVELMLEVSPEDRATAEDLLKHEWLQDIEHYQSNEMLM